MSLPFAFHATRLTSLVFAESVGALSPPAGDVALGAAAVFAASLILAVAFVYRAKQRRTLGRLQKAFDHYAEREIAHCCISRAGGGTDDTETMLGTGA